MDYEYRGLMAVTWDLFRGDTSQWSDRFFYRDRIREHGAPVLDVGCGTGRLLLDFLHEGVDMDGVDNSPEMLTLCREKAQSLGLEPTLYAQVMESLDIPRRYQTIIVPSSSFQLLLEEESAKQTMRRFYDHLLPGGALIMPFMDLGKFWDGESTDWSEWRLAREATREDGTHFRKFSRNRYTPETRMEHTEDRYEAEVNGVIVASEEHRRSPATRSYTQEQALTLYREAGFSNLQLYREFTQEPASGEDRVFSLCGIKPQ